MLRVNDSDERVNPVYSAPKSDGDISQGYWDAYAQRLALDGLLPIALNRYIPPDLRNAKSKTSKAPVIKGWQKLGRMGSVSDCAMWAEHYKGRRYGISLPCLGIFGLDADYRDEWLSGEIWRIACEVFGVNDFKRIGNAPKFLLLFRVKGTTFSVERGVRYYFENFVPSYEDSAFLRQTETGDFECDNIDVDADFLRRTGVVFSCDAGYTNVGKVEILAMNADGRTAKQFVAFGIHNDTGRPYVWPKRSPLDCKPEDLPEATAEQVAEFCRRVDAYIENNQSELAKRGITPEARGSRAERNMAKRETLPLAEKYDDLDIKPFNYFSDELGRIQERIIGRKDRAKRQEFNKAIFGAAAHASRYANTYRIRGESGDILSREAVIELLRDAVLKGAQEGRKTDNDPAKWTDDLIKQERENGWEKGVNERLAPTPSEDDDEDNAPAAAAIVAQIKGITSREAGIAPHGAQQQNASPAPAWADPNGKTHENLRPAAAAVPMPPAMPAAQLQQQVADTVASFFRDAERYHTDRPHTVTMADQAAATHQDVFLMGLVRYLAMEGTGAGKTTACIDQIANFYANESEMRNILYLAPNHKIAAQTERELKKRGLRVVRLIGADKLCVEPSRKLDIKRYASKGLPSSEVCNGCPLRDTCAYQAQFAPASQTVVIAQQAHLVAGKIPIIDDPSSAPLFATIFDESVLQSSLVTTRGGFRDLFRRIVLPPVPAGVGDPVRRAEAEGMRKNNEVIINGALARLRGLIAKADTGAHEKGSTSRHLLKRADFSWFFDPCFDYRPRVSWILDTARETRRLFLAETMKTARGNAAKDIRGTRASTLRLIDHLINILDVIRDNAGRVDDSIIGLRLNVFRPKKGKPHIDLWASRLRPLPKHVTGGSIMFMDATGDVRVIEALLRESSKFAPRYERLLNGSRGLIVSDDVRRPVWNISRGEAATPHATKIKVIGGPVKASQILRGAPEAKVRRLGGATTINGTEYVNGDLAPAGAPKTGWMPPLRRHSNAKMIERWLVGCVADLKAKGANRIAIFTIKRFADELRLRTWVARDGVDVDHFGRLSGVNSYEKYDAVILIGQSRPNLDDIALMGAALALAHPDKPSFKLPGYVQDVFRPIEVGGQPFEMCAPSLDDDCSGLALGQMQDALSVQAYGRLRLHRRTAATPCTLIVADETPGEAWNEAMVFLIPDEVDIFQSRHGRLPIDAAEAVSMEPELFVTRRQASRLLANVAVPAAAVGGAPRVVNGSKLQSKVADSVESNQRGGAKIPEDEPKPLIDNPTLDCSSSISAFGIFAPNTVQNEQQSVVTVKRKSKERGRPSTLSDIPVDLFAEAETACGSSARKMAPWLTERTGLTVTRHAIDRHRKGQKAAAEALADPHIDSLDGKDPARSPQKPSKLSELHGHVQAPQMASADAYASAIDTLEAVPACPAPPQCLKGPMLSFSIN